MTERDLARFWQKVEPEPNSGCWLWVGSFSGLGYGCFCFEDRSTQAHRVAYNHFVGDIPRHLEVDHLCAVRSCVNPAHMELVTHRENLLRGKTITASQVARTRCPRGHLYDGRDGSHRFCRRCRTALHGPVSLRYYRRTGQRYADLVAQLASQALACCEMPSASRLSRLHELATAIQTALQT